MISKPIEFNIIGPRIALARREQNMSEQELCERLALTGLDIGIYLLSLIENQEAQIYDYQVPAFAEALGVSPDWLFHGLKYTIPIRHSFFE